jgi:methyl-accepting chemotaxis protein
MTVFRGFRAKLLGGFGVMLLLLALVGWIGWRTTVSTSADVTGLLDNEFTQLAELSRTSRGLLELRNGAAGIAYLTADAVQRAALQTADAQWLANIDDDMHRYAASDLTPDERRLLATWQQDYSALVVSRRQLIAIREQGAVDQATAFRLQETFPLLRQTSDNHQALLDLQLQSNSSLRGEIVGGTDQAGRQIIVASLIAILLALVLVFYLSRDMRHVTGEIRQGASSVSTASDEILAAVAQQSSGATEQSAAIAQTTATVSQVKASAEAAVEMALVVSETAREASRVAGEGVQAARDAAAGMADLREKVESIAENILALSEQSQRIGEIIATVNDLADQSNLLALNAAIEASRAGEQGRGFAVVATEIRNLAEQSKAATAQVRTLLGDIQRATNATVLSTEQGTRGVDNGMLLVEQTGQTIGELAHVIDQASDSAHQIAASVRQHSVGMEQVAAAMVNINQATTNNLSATADTRKAAERLTTLAGGLTRTVAQYKV